VREPHDRALSFGGVAEQYERARPGYPEDAVEWLVGDARRVVDLAAGTGKLTRRLVARGLDVRAVEPSPGMLAQLRAAVPAAQVLEGRAEEIPMPDESADAIVVAQAFHWFDAPVALREIARVLRPGGALGLVWNDRDDDVPWVARLSGLIGADQDPGADPAELIDPTGLFGPVEEQRFRFELRVDRETLLDLVASRSWVAVQDPETRTQILAAVTALYDEVAADDGLVLPYVTYAYRARRKGARD
jgi:SAM-dependent methyltransferase